jgi:hypothetical protein
VSRLKRFSITTKLMLLILGLQFVTIGVLTYYNEQNLVKQEYLQADEKLQLVAYAANEFVLQEYHDKILDKNSIPNDAYMEMMIKLSSFVNKADVQYVYSFVKRGDKVLVTSTSVTSEDFDKENYELFFEEYEVSSDLLKVFTNKRVLTEETNDKYGHVRTIILPFTNKYGETYVVGVDIEINEIQEILYESRKQLLLIAAIIFALTTVVSMLLVRIVISRIPSIKRGLQEFFDYINSKRDGVKPIPLGHHEDEINDMAKMINDNVELIAVNIKKDNDLINEIALLSQEVKRGTFSAHITREGNNPALNEVRDIMNDVVHGMQLVILDILKVLEEFSKQNYTSKLDNYTLDGEMAQLVKQMSIFGKNISDYMLNTAYDALNLEKDSKFLNEYILGLTTRINGYLKELHEIQEVASEVSRNNNKSQQYIVEIEKEKSYAQEILEKLTSEIDESLETDLDERARLERKMLLQESVEDISHSLVVIEKANEQLKSVLAGNDTTQEFVIQKFEVLEQKVIDNKSAADQTQKVSHNLSELSKRMREYIEKSEFSGKENITILMNYSDK